MATQNTFQSGKFPEYRLNCELTDDGGYWICEATRKECSSAVEYGVVCKTYEELYNDCLSSSNTAQTTSSMAGIGVLAAVLAGVIVGWIVTSVVLLRKIRVTGGQKQQ